MKKIAKLFIFSISIFVLFGSLFSYASTSTNSTDVHLQVDGCNNNGICEPSLGEDINSCPADCHVVCTGNNCGGGGGTSINYFYDINISPAQTTAIINWKSRYPALATLKWGTTTDYRDGSLSETTYSGTHSALLINLLSNNKYYFLIEGQNTDSSLLVSVPGNFYTLSKTDNTSPKNVTNFTATPNTLTITLTWRNPIDPNFDYVRIMRNRVSGNNSPQYGTLVYEGNAQYAIDKDVSLFTRYFYTIFVRNKDGAFSSGVEANAILNPIKIDPCFINPASCIPPTDPCTINPSSCANPPVDPCLATPSPCANPPDPCVINPSSCNDKPEKSIEKLPKVENIAPPVAVGISVILSVVSAILSGAFSFGEIGLILLRLWSLLLIAFGLKKRTPPWGVVYDSVTKQPLDPAYVVLLDKDGKEVASCITDLDGRYGFVVEPGVYTIVATKTNYAFPSTKLSGMRGDELYGNLYFGHDIEVTKSGSIIASNIPLDPLHFDWNEFAKKDQHLLKFFRARDVWFGRLSNVLFWIGSVYSVYAVIVSPTGYNIAIVGLSTFVYILRILGLQIHPKGSISEGLSKQPLPFSILRVYSPGTGQEIYHKVADKAGRYYAIIPNGKYTVLIDKKNIDQSYTKVPVSLPVSVSKGYLKKNFKL